MGRARGKTEDLADGPVVVTPLHRFDRELTTNAGGPKAWRKLTPLQAAFEKDQLGGGDMRYTADQRLEAGMVYASNWDMAFCSGKNTLDLDRAAGRGTNGQSLGLQQIKATGWLRRIEAALGARDRMIARLVLGEGHWPSEAIAIACRTDQYVRATVPRFRETLDSLIESIEEAGRRGFK